MTDPASDAARASESPAEPRSLLASSGKVLASRVVLLVGSLLTVVVTARELGASGRGAITLILTIVAFGGIIFSIGLPVAGRLHLVGVSPVSTGAYLGLAVGTTAIEATVTPLAAAMFLPAVDVHLSTLGYVAVGALAAFNGFSSRVAPAVAAFGRVVASSWWVAAGYLAQGVLCAAAVVVGTPGLVDFVALLAAGVAVPSMGAVWSLRRMGHSIRPTVDRRDWRRLIRTGVPSLSTLVSESATFRIDRLILGVLRTPAAVGIYSVGVTAAEMFRLIPWSINQLVFYEVVTGRLSKRRLRHIRIVTIGGMAAVGLVGVLVAPWVIDTLLGPSFARSVEPFRILLLAELGLAWYLFDSTLLLSSHQVKKAAAVALFGVAMILIADFLLIRAHGITGAAIASVLTYWSMAAVARTLLTRARRRGEIRLMEPDAELAVEIEASAPPITES